MLKTIKQENLSSNSWKVYHPNGKLMFFADDKKKNWYMKKNLAQLTASNDIVLTFSPSGAGFDENDVFGLSPRQVQCVCCGEKNKTIMQKHHIVPYMYRKYMPLEYKNKNHHDVVLICYTCHEKYELSAWELKSSINKKYSVVEDTRKTSKNICVNMLGISGDYTHVSSYIKTFLVNKGKLPVAKKDIMSKVIAEFIGNTNFGEHDLLIANEFIKENKNTITIQPIPVGEQVMNKISDLDDFVYLWRTHFIETMHPRYMPIGWSIKRKYLPRLN